jgi:PIN domain nuclease of toxin-antitoxin system
VRLLLDTHIWIWSLTDPSRLAPKVRASFLDPAHELWLSSISVWEVLVLMRKERLRVTGSAQQWVADALTRAPLREAPITHAVALESQRLSLAHWDPADRFIAATAKLLDATLVTADARLIAARFLKILPNL